MYWFQYIIHTVSLYRPQGRGGQQCQQKAGDEQYQPQVGDITRYFDPMVQVCVFAFCEVRGRWYSLVYTVGSPL